MTNAIMVFRKHRLALAAAIVLLAVALAAGTLFAANERQEPELRPPGEQSFMDATDPGRAADLPVTADAKPEPPQNEPGSDVNQVAPDAANSDAFEQWLAEQPEKMGFITQEDAITADAATMDWLLYQAVYKGVLTQEEADAVQSWYEQRPSAAEAPELLQYQPVYLDRPSNRGIAIESLPGADAR